MSDDTLQAAGENDYSRGRAEYLQRRLMSLGNIDTTPRIEDDLELRDRLTEAGNLIGTLLRRDSFLQDQLTQVRGEMERQHKAIQDRGPDNFYQFLGVFDAAEKREKALRDAAQDAITWLKAKEHDGTHARPCTECKLIDLFRRILERGEQG